MRATTLENPEDSMNPEEVSRMVEETKLQVHEAERTRVAAVKVLWNLQKSEREAAAQGE